MNRNTPRSTRPLAFLPPLALALAAGTANAATETLECRLYMGLGTEVGDGVEPSASPVTLGTTRRHGVCLFADGTVAEKQFVFIVAARTDGSSGSNVGYSVYGFEDGATLLARFDGGWGEGEPYGGDYEILSGTGRFDGASGDGTITTVASDWTTTGIVDIVLNVATPD